MDSPDRVMLRLLAQGAGTKDIDFPHLPGKRQARLAELRLIMQGCLTPDGKLTTLGTQVNKLPLSVPYALMVNAALTLEVAHEIITIAAIFGTGSLTGLYTRRWAALVTEEKTSDSLAQLALFEKFEAMGVDGRREYYVLENNFWIMKERQRSLIAAVRLATGLETLPSGGGREAIIRCLTQGLLLHLYRRGEDGHYTAPADPYERRLGSESVIGHPEWVIGMPRNLESAVEGRPVTLLSGATAVDPKLLCEIAPWLVHTRTDSHCRYDTEQDAVMTRHWVYFLGHMIGCEEKVAPDHPETERFRAELRASLNDAGLLAELNIILAYHRKASCLLKSERQEIEKAIAHRARITSLKELTVWATQAKGLCTLGRAKMEAKMASSMTKPLLPDIGMGSQPGKLHTRTLYLKLEEAEAVEVAAHENELSHEQARAILGEKFCQELVELSYLRVVSAKRVVFNTAYLAHTDPRVVEASANLPKKGRVVKVYNGHGEFKGSWNARLNYVIKRAKKRGAKTTKADVVG